MEMLSIKKTFLKEVCGEIEILEEGSNRFRVFTPFTFGDGDHVVIVLKQEFGQWILTDEGDTLFHLSLLGLPESAIYGTRRDLIDGILEEFAVRERGGELIAKIEQEQYGIVLYRFIQAIVKISDLVYLSQERVKSAFLEDFRTLIEAAIPNANRYEFNWSDRQRDSNERYKVDCRINFLQRPLMVFALQNDDKIRDSIITIRQFEHWNIPFFPIGIFKDMEGSNQKAVAKFADVCETTFSNIEDEETRDRIVAYLREKAGSIESN
jgi:Domain of unknown function DUF1828